MKTSAVRRWTTGSIAILASVLIFLVPFAFILLTASKSADDAAALSFTWPKEWRFWDNLVAVLTTNDSIVLLAFFNSIILTVVSVTILVVLSAAVGYVLQRRRSWLNSLVNFFVLAGLIVPAALVPTIWVMQGLGLFKTLPGLILIEVTYGLSFSILLFRAFVATVPRELDEAAIIDGAGPIRLFFRVIMPLLKPIIITVIVVQSVAIFNDFSHPLYFLPGDEYATVQVTLFYFQSEQAASSWNLVFMDILLITILPLTMYIFFNRQIVAGMTSGAIKG